MRDILRYGIEVAKSGSSKGPTAESPGSPPLTAPASFARELHNHHSITEDDSTECKKLMASRSPPHSSDEAIAQSQSNEEMLEATQIQRIRLGRSHTAPSSRSHPVYDRHNTEHEMGAERGREHAGCPPRPSIATNVAGSNSRHGIDFGSSSMLEAVSEAAWHSPSWKAETPVPSL